VDGFCSGFSSNCKGLDIGLFLEGYSRNQVS
jgi:hypothetical protein